MPLTGNFAELRSLQRKFVDLATPGSEGEKTILGAVKRRLKPVLARQYRGGQPINGGAWKARKAGGPALQSKKLGSAIRFVRRIGGVVVVYMVDWLRAQDEGHTYKSRDRSYLKTYSVTGELLNKRKAKKRTAVYDVPTRVHRVKEWTLPARRQYPRSITAPMQEGIVSGFRAGMAEWHRGGAR